MTSGIRGRLRPAPLAALVALATLACGEEGVTPDCPELTLYDVRAMYGELPEAPPGASAAERAAVERRRDEIEELRRELGDQLAEEREAAIEAGCMTPLAEPPPPDPAD